jgi:hypothetical protein
MSTNYYQTDESARESIRNYRDLQGLDTFEDAIYDMQECFDDLDDEDKSALCYVNNKPDMLAELKSIKRKVINRWCVQVIWSDGTVEERTDIPDLRDLEPCFEAWETEANQ